ncbi:MAG: hypothetical protein FJ026_09765 [Chloroflexi bacterium]|nr:hypothetical protein [Chloroflexota bacterium]
MAKKKTDPAPSAAPAKPPGRQALRDLLEEANGGEPLPLTLLKWAREAKAAGAINMACKHLARAADFAYAKLRTVDVQVSGAKAALEALEQMSDEELAKIIAEEDA